MTIILMLIIFIIGYALITLEHKIDINKTAIALFLGVTLWVVYIIGGDQYVIQNNGAAFNHFLQHNPELTSEPLSSQIQKFIAEDSILAHVGEIAEIIFFLMGAMTIVELIDRHGGFNFVNNRITTRKKVKLLWIITLMTFFLSAVLDNLTTAIVMVMVLRKLIANQKERWTYASIVILAANAGGAFSPIGDVTTIMLWIKGNITSTNTILNLFLPSLVSVLVPLLIVSVGMKGSVKANMNVVDKNRDTGITRHEKIIIFCIGVGGLMMVPVFRAVTGLPPFIGILGVLAILWIYTELMYVSKNNIEESIKYRVSKVIKHIDMPTILFFFGILMAVAALQEVGILSMFASYLDTHLHDVYLINVLIGCLSSIVDNVPLVAGAMGMYQVVDPTILATVADPTYMANFVADGAFWQLLAYCAGVGGSILIIGSAAGVVVMGLEKISFGWYLKKISWIALIGYLAGIGVYTLQSMILSAI